MVGMAAELEGRMPREGVVRKDICRQTSKLRLAH